jgi:hypothetical protein
MTKKNPQTFSDFLDAIQAGGDVSKACRRLSISRMSAIRWLKASKQAAANEEQDSIYRFEYQGQVDWLHNFKRDAERAIVEDVLANALIRARDGTRQPALYQGRRVPKLDYKRLARGLPEHECYLCDPITGDIEYEEVWQPPSNELTAIILGANLKKYSKRQTVEHQHNHSGGVLIAHQMGNAPRERLPVALEVLEPVTEAVITDASNMLEPGEVQPDVIAAPTSEPEPAPPPPPPKPMSDLQRDLIDRARARGLL